MFQNKCLPLIFNTSNLLFRLFLLIVLIGLNTCLAQGQAKTKKEIPLTRILLIFDASNSMNAAYQNSTRIETAKILFAHFVDSLQKLNNLQLALRVYGHMKKFPPQDCNDTHLEIPFAKNNAAAIKAKVASLVPKGTTPIAHSLSECIEDFPADPALNIVILITDGIDECGGDPCNAAKQLLENGIVLKPFIIGIGLTEQQAKKFECVGDFFDISEPGTFGSILNIIIKKTLNETTAQVNLLDNNNRATMTDVNMTFYNRKTNEIKYNFVHKLTASFFSDTLRLKPSTSYKLVIHTIPEIVKDSVKLEVGRHNIISVNVPQGTLQLGYSVGSGNKIIDGPLCMVRKSGALRTLNIQKLNTSENYLTGTYDLEILCLPRIIKRDVLISPGSVINIHIPQPGTLRINARTAVYGSIFLEETAELKWVCTLTDQKNQTFNLQPGKYKIIYRVRSSKKSSEKSEDSFTILPGQLKTLDF